LEGIFCVLRLRNFGAKRKSPLGLKGWGYIYSSGGIKLAPKNLGGGVWGKGWAQFFKKVSPFFPGLRARNRVGGGKGL